MYFIHTFSSDGVSCASSHGFWPLCCHLWSFEVFQQADSTARYLYWGLHYNQMFCCPPCYSCLYSHIFFLSLPCSLPLFLPVSRCHPVGLWWHLTKHFIWLVCCCILLECRFSRNLVILCFHPPFFARDCIPGKAA